VKRAKIKESCAILSRMILCTAVLYRAILYLPTVMATVLLSEYICVRLYSLEQVKILVGSHHNRGAPSVTTLHVKTHCLLRAVEPYV
jgi:hypothetical protein